MDLFRQFECRQAIVAIVKAIKSPATRLQFANEGLPVIIQAASEQDWVKIEEILHNYIRDDGTDVDNYSNFMEHITKLYDILATVECVPTVSMEENQIIADAILNVDVPLTTPNNLTVCKRCHEPDYLVDCRKHTCQNCLNNRRPRRSTSNKYSAVNLMCRNCTDNNNNRRSMPIECSICCDWYEKRGKSIQCTDCPNQFHEACHPNASKCPECLSNRKHQLNNNEKNHVMLTKIGKEFWPVVIISKLQLPMELAEQRFTSLKPDAAIVFCIGKNIYRKVFRINLLPLQLNNRMARDAICQPHVAGLNDAIRIADSISSDRRGH